MPSTGPGRNKSGTGLKILWIPGRKKNHDKGVFKPTNHHIEHKHGERNNEPWSLGGSKAHDDIAGGGWVQWTIYIYLFYSVDMSK